MTTIAIVQARMSSSRLPGKALARLGDKAQLAHVVERVLLARKPDRVTVATSDDPSDDVIERFCQVMGFDVYRGSLLDVQARFLGLAELAGATNVVRITADCPLVHPTLIDLAVEVVESSEHDYCSNTLFRTFPRGLDVEAFSVDALRESRRMDLNEDQVEHVTTGIYSHLSLFKLASLECTLSRARWDWSCDTDSDLGFLRTLFQQAPKGASHGPGLAWAYQWCEANTAQIPVSTVTGDYEHSTSSTNTPSPRRIARLAVPPSTVW